ncbi:MAG: hypothetical protein M5R36_29750 [Deltaproteobacteria bacterium]|nr:hypothetical protein [Deltaproteobacteria bacterium]
MRAFYVGPAQPIEPDKANRILIPPDLRTEIGLERDVYLLGMGDMFQIYDTAIYRQRISDEAKRRFSEIFGEVASKL